ncbi:hypothetical protein KUCAC02_024991, partial [Chaenocephalus aceratus]
NMMINLKWRRDEERVCRWRERGNMEERKENTSVINPPAVQHQLGKGQKSRGNGLYAVAKDKLNYEFTGREEVTEEHALWQHICSESREGDAAFTLNNLIQQLKRRETS